MNKLQEETERMECRLGCGACCIAPSISSFIPGMPGGKPAGVRCIQLSEDNLCMLFGSPRRPAVCGSLKPSGEMCGKTTEDAMKYLERLEKETAAEETMAETVKSNP
jgi:Fe-S-cluster containining protein